MGKANIGKRVQNASTGLKGTIVNVTVTNSGLPAYRVKVDGRERRAIWSARFCIILSSEGDKPKKSQEPGETAYNFQCIQYTSSTPVNEVINSGDEIVVMSRKFFENTVGFTDTAKKLPNVKHKWNDEGKMTDLMGKRITVDSVSSRIVRITDDNGTQWSLSTDSFVHLKQHVEANPKHVERYLRMIDMLKGETKSVPEIAYITFRKETTLSSYISEGDTVTVLPRSHFKATVGLDSEGNPKVRVGWDTGDCKMQKLMGVEVKVVSVYRDEVHIVDPNNDERWQMSSDSFYYPYKAGISASRVDYFISDRGRTLREFTGVRTLEELKFGDIPPPPPPKQYPKMEKEEEILHMIAHGPVLLEGPVGSGKTTMAMAICEKLGLEFLSETMTRQTTLSMLMGFKTVTGEYVPAKLRDAYENGKFYLLEELNGGDPNVLLCLNTIENGFLAFPDKVVKAHPNFRMMATMNDITNAKDFGGRSVLDLSTLNRYHKIYMPQQLDSRFEPHLVELSKIIDKWLSSRGHTRLVTTRDLMRFSHMSETIDPVVAAKKCLFPSDAKIEYNEIQNMVDTAFADYYEQQAELEEAA